MIKTCRILNGKDLAEKQLSEATEKIRSMKNAGKTLTLATVQVGESADTQLYANFLKNYFGRVGIDLTTHTLPHNASEQNLITQIGALNRDARVTGIMVFSPLPKTIDPANILDNLDMRKDVEGRTFLKSHFGVFSPTSNAVLTLIEHALKESGSGLAGKEAVVVGHSDLVGKPTAVLLMDKLATVTVCHKETREIRSHVEKADIVVAAVGKPHVVKGDWIKPGAVVIDVGENMVDGKLVGDVEFDRAKERAAFISPVPGGVGPLTNVMLIQNLIRLHELNEKRNGHR